MIRTCLAAIYVFIYFLISLPFLGMTWLFSHVSPNKMADLEFRFVQWGFRCVNRICGHNIEVIGIENIPDNTPVLFVGNHRSIFDIITSYPNMPNITGYVAKIGLKKIPVLSFIMARVHCLFINNSDHKQSLKIILQTTENIKNGISMFIYPEGKRNRNDIEHELLPMHNGSFKPAQRTKCPIIPVATSHTDLSFEKHFPSVTPSHIIIRFGKPFSYADLTDDEKTNIGDHTSGIISDMLKMNEEMI